jgi:predicted DNA-binding WGR domain protein
MKRNHVSKKKQTKGNDLKKKWGRRGEEGGKKKKTSFL